MQRMPRLWWPTSVLVTLFILAGCAPRAGGGQTAVVPGAQAITVDLPALVIDFDSEGLPRIGNMSVAQLGAFLPGGLLDQLRLPPEAVAFMTSSNIQHIQISNSPTGLIILVNGKAIPSLKWDGEILTATADVLSQLGVGVSALEKLLPIVTQVGVGVILRFPLAEGVAAIPAYVAKDPAALAKYQAAQAEFLAAVENRPSITIPVFYDADGSWRVGDLTDAEWTNLTGQAIFTAMRMTPETIDQLMQSGIREISISTDSQGIHLAVNGNPLPYIGWADGEISNVLDLVDQTGLSAMLDSQGLDMGELVAVVDNLLPVVQTAEISISAQFPTAVASVQ